MEWIVYDIVLGFTSCYTTISATYVHCAVIFTWHSLQCFNIKTHGSVSCSPRKWDACKQSEYRKEEKED